MTFKKLKTKLLLLLLLIGILPVIIISSIALKHSNDALADQAFAQLVSVREVKKNQIESYLARANKDIVHLAESEDTLKIVKQLEAGHISKGITSDGGLILDTNRYHEIWQKSGRSLLDYVTVYGYSDVFLISIDGNVIYTANKNADLGTNLVTGPNKGSSLADLWKKVGDTQGLQVADFQLYQPSGNLPAAFIGNPVKNQSGEIVAISVLQLSIDAINEIMSQRTGMGETGETYLVGSDNLMRSDSLLDPENLSVTASITHSNTIDTPATAAGLSGISGSEITVDYLDKPVLSSYTPLKFGDNIWVLVAEKHVSEAFASINELTMLVGMILVVAIIVLIIISFIFAGSLTNPLIELTNRLENVAVTGDYKARVLVRSKDEFGQSAQAFNTLMESTQTAVNEIKQVMEKLAEGDFSCRIKAELHGDLLSIKEATNLSLENVEKAERNKSEMALKAVSVARENARVRQALDNVTNNIMIADSNYQIIYMNRSSRTLMKKAEADFATIIPGFNAESVVGNSMDMFHRTPSRQRKVLDALTSTHTLQFQAGSKIMALKVNAIVDDHNERIGTVIEWNDRTAEDAIEREVDAVIDAASKGDFSHQLSVDNKSGFLLNLSKGLNNLTSNIEAALADIQRIFGAMAQGDLTQRIEKDYEGRLAQLKKDTNSTIDKLTQVIENIRDASASISMSSTEIASGNRDLSQRTEKQATSLQETAVSMEQMTGAVKNSAENAIIANALSDEAQEKAQIGGKVVTSTIDAMEDIRNSSDKIAAIITVIDEIAFQTNLLALNAAVEAARAGNQGRGFAVVAGEVRVLAQRSASAAKQIKELIRDSNNKVNCGSELVSTSGATLKEIVQTVETVGEKMAEISTAAQEQSSGIEQVNKAINRMDSMTMQNAAMVQQATTAGENMLAQAVEMNAMMEFFTILNQNSQVKSPPLEVRAQKSTAAPKPLKHPDPNTDPSPSGATDKTNKVHVSKFDDEEWDEF